MAGDSGFHAYLQLQFLCIIAIDAANLLWSLSTLAVQEDAYLLMVARGKMHALLQNWDA